MSDSGNVSPRRFKAFISYSSHDREFASWLHRAIERYRVPRKVAEALRNSNRSATLYPLFRDREEVAATHDLSAAICSALENSDYLIVICSPDSARSLWVNEEVLQFRRLGREHRILAIIAGGNPQAGKPGGLSADQQCFPPALIDPSSSGRPLAEEAGLIALAADARPVGDGRENAKLKLIANLLGVDLGTLKDRDAEASRRRAFVARSIAVSMVVLALAAGLSAVISQLSANVARERLFAMQRGQTLAAMEKVSSLNPETAASLLLEVLPREVLNPERPLLPEALAQLATTLSSFPDRYEVGHEVGQQVAMLTVASGADRMVVAMDRSTQLGVYDLADGRPELVRKLDLSDEPVDLSLSADGQTLLVALRSSSPVLLRIADPAFRKVFAGAPAGSVREVALSPSGKSAAIINSSGYLTVASVDDEKFGQSVLLGDLRSPEAVFASDQQLLVRLSQPDEFVLFHVPDAKEAWRISRQGEVTAIYNGQFITSFEGSGKIFSLKDGQEMAWPPVPWLRTGSIAAISSDGSRLLVDNGNASFEVRDIKGGLLRQDVKPLGFMKYVALTSSGSSFVTASRGDAAAHVIAIKPGATHDITELLAGAALVEAAFSTDARYLWILASDGSVQTFRTDNWQQVAKWRTTGGTPLSLQAGLANTGLVAASNEILVFEVGKPQAVAHYVEPDVVIHIAAAAPQLDNVAIIQSDGKLMLWHPGVGMRKVVADLSTLGIFRFGPETVKPLLGLWVSHDSARIAARYGSSFGFVDATTGGVIGPYDLSTEGAFAGPLVVDADFSRDGSQFAVALGEAGYRIFDVSAAKEVAKIDGVWTNRVEFSPDGRRLLLGQAVGSLAPVNIPQLVDSITQTNIGPLLTFGPPLRTIATSSSVAWLGDDHIVGMLDSEVGVGLVSARDRVLTIWNRELRLPTYRLRAGIQQNLYVEQRYFTSRDGTKLVVSTPEGRLIAAHVRDLQGQPLIDAACTAAPPIDHTMREWLGLSGETESKSQQWLDFILRPFGTRSQRIGRASCGASEL